MWSTSTLLSSSGIARSNERIPASTWIAATPICAATRAPDRVELVSPKTSTASGFTAPTTGSRAPTMRAV